VTLPDQRNYGFSIAPSYVKGKRMLANKLTVRSMCEDELGLAVDWAAAEGWNPGLHDAECFYRADPTGFLIGLVDDEPVATLSAVRYNQNFGFLGFYIVSPSWRGQGHGLTLWNAGMDNLRGCTIGLDGVVEQQHNYQKSGFALAHNNIRYQGTVGRPTASSPDCVPLSEVVWEECLRYDREFFPADRDDFLRTWITRPQSTALACMTENILCGYGVARACRAGYKLGPLFADSPEIAETLYVQLTASIPQDTSVFLDISSSNIEARRLVERHGMQAVFETARMYRGEAPELPIERLYGITSFELG
jgi:ribosomal protein S18 acetylase RimI-like enzyme